MISEDDRCSCGHHRAHHVLACKAMRPVGIGSTPPGFRQHMERCPCLGFVLWRSAEDDLSDAGHVSTVAFLLFVIVGSLVFLALLKAAQPAVCWMNDDAVRYCPGYSAVTK